jgi:hypothetical protein
MFKRILFVLIQVIPFTLVFAQPTITSFTPVAGKVGTSITISGTNFSATPSNNTVYVGNMKASVTAASTTSLTVTVPTGAMYKPIAVTVSNLTGYSHLPFQILYGNSESVSSSTFASPSTFSCSNKPSSLDAADLDGDGKIDLVAGIPNGSGAVCVFRNTSSSGSVSFATRQDFSTADLCQSLHITDLDGDGKMDVIASNRNSSTNNLQVFRNTSSSGSISFATAVNFNRPDFPFIIASGDLNADGKPDLVHTNFNSNNISVNQNTSTSGAISLAANFQLTAGSLPGTVEISDLDLDGKPDIIFTNYNSNNISYYRNIHTSGALSSSSFDSKVDIGAGSGTSPQGLFMADIDGDGKKDIVATHQSSGNVAVHRNTSTPGSISFATLATFTSGTTARSTYVTDVNGDGKVDVVSANIGSNTLRVYQSSSTSGTISLPSSVTFSTGSQPYFGIAADIDGDTKPDMISADYNSSRLSVFRNTQLATEPSTASSFMSFNSLTGSSMTVSWANGNGARRIVALKASGTPPSVTSPVDATEYTANASFGSGADLGSGWYVVYDGTGSSVSVTDLTLNQQYYCVIFEYNGKDATINYQTSYASGTQLLPVEFLSFTATGSEKGVQLNWSTAWEINNSHFEIERSTQGINEFTYLDEHRGKGNSLAISEYSYLDNEIAKHAGPTFYRLKQVDLNGAYKYSNVAVASLIEEKMTFVGPEAFPTVVYKELYVKLGSIENKLISVSVVDSRGQPVRESFDNFDIINCLTWDAGIYYVLIDYLDAYGTLKRQATKISKQ